MSGTAATFSPCQVSLAVMLPFTLTSSQASLSGSLAFRRLKRAAWPSTTWECTEQGQGCEQGAAATAADHASRSEASMAGGLCEQGRSAVKGARPVPTVSIAVSALPILPTSKQSMVLRGGMHTHTHNSAITKPMSSVPAVLCHSPSGEEYKHQARLLHTRSDSFLVDHSPAETWSSG